MKTVTPRYSHPENRFLRIGIPKINLDLSHRLYGGWRDSFTDLRQYRRRVLQPGMVAINLHKSGADQGRWSLHLVRPAIPVSRQIPE